MGCPHRSIAATAYRPRDARSSPLRKVLSAAFDEFLAVYDERYAHRYGPLRAVVPKKVEAFLRCGIFDWGFARVRCPDCAREFLVPYSCKCRGLCPSCQAKRQAELGAFLTEEILEPVPHRQIVLSLPRRLRPFFLRNRKRLSKLARAAWETVRDLLQESLEEPDAVPGAVVAIHTFGNLLDWHPHAHLIVAWGLFRRSDGSFVQAKGVPGEKVLERLFRHKILRMLLDEGAIDESVAANMLGWKHTGFGAHVGEAIGQEQARRMENLSRYLVRPPVVVKRIVAAEGEKIIYKGEALHPRHGANFRIFDPLDFIAEVTSHIPDVHEKSTFYYGWASSRTRAWRRERGLLGKGKTAEAEDVAGEEERAPRAVRQSWARMLRRVYEIDPLVCPACRAEMKIIAFIEREETVRQILEHLGAWEGREVARSPPGARPPLSEEEWTERVPPDGSEVYMESDPDPWADGEAADPDPYEVEAS